MIRPYSQSKNNLLRHQAAINNSGGEIPMSYILYYIFYDIS